MSERSQANPEVHDLIVNRWSPRSFDQSVLPQKDLDVILEAAGWAPSAFNGQPWTFLYAHRGDENWDRFLSLLVDSNQVWAKNASVLVFVVSDRLARKSSGETSNNHSHSFDAGAAWALAAIQATAMGYHAHGMGGVHFAKAQEELNVPEDRRLEAAFVIGKQAPKENLPEGLQAREVQSGRKPLSEITRAGSFA